MPAFEQAEAALGRRAFLLGSLAAVGVAAFPGRARAATGGATVIKAARLFDGAAMRSPGVLVIVGDRVVSMSAGDAGSGARVLDFGDATIMPGLIDAHTHIAAPVLVDSYMHAFDTPDRPSGDSPAEAAIYGLRNAQAMLANGFTTVRDVGGGSGVDLAIRNAIRRGIVSGPRVLASGPALSITGGHGDLNSVPQDINVERWSGVAFGPYGFREQVREHVKRHVDLIKITATGGVLSYGDVWDVPQFNLDEIQAVVDESAKFSLKVAAHAHGDRGIAQAVTGGCSSIEHCTGVSEKTLKLMEQRGTYLVPTIWALDSILQPGNPNKIASGGLEKAHAAAKLRNEGMQRAIGTSVKMAYGTDAGVFPHKENNRDFSLLASMGMRPVDLMKSTTSWAADLLGTTDRGTLAVGKLADVVVFAGDPSSRIAHIESKPQLVMVGGTEVKA